SGALAYSRTTNLAYDNYGNVTVTALTADGVNFDTNELDTETTYLYDGDQWIVDRVNEIKVYSGLSTFKGMVFAWTGNQLTAVRNKTGPQSWVETSMTYNANGLLESVTEPPTTDQLTRTTTFVYDDTFHAYPKTITYPQTVTNGSPVTHIVQKTYRPD